MKAYVAGFLALPYVHRLNDHFASTKSTVLSLTFDEHCDRGILRSVRDWFNGLDKSMAKKVNHEEHPNRLTFKCGADQWTSSLSRLLDLHADRSSGLQHLRFPRIAPSWPTMSDFIRGVFDSSPESFECPSPKRKLGFDSTEEEPLMQVRMLIKFFDESRHFIEEMLDSASCPIEQIDQNRFVVEGPSAYDFLFRLHIDIDDPKSSETVLCDPTRHLSFCRWRRSKASVPQLSVFRAEDRAVLPKRKRPSDAGWDVTVTAIVKSLGDKTTLYETDLILQPEHGWYALVVPRSSLSSTGYIMTNSVGVIDANYRGTVKIALTKIDDTKPDLPLGSRVAQILMMPQHYGSVIQLRSASQLELTERGAQGFGSSGFTISL